MSLVGRVFVVDDQAGDIRWMLDLITSRGYSIDLATNEEAAKRQLDLVKKGGVAYSLAVFDVMVAVKDLMEIVKIDDDFYEDSRDTGLRLCHYVREELGVPHEELPIICLSVRDDDEIKRALDELKIPLFNRAPQSQNESIREEIKRRLPIEKLPSEGAASEAEVTRVTRKSRNSITKSAAGRSPDDADYGRA